MSLAQFVPAMQGHNRLATAPLHTVKNLRFFLLALLVMVLPLRGAVAAVAHCMADAAGASAAAQTHEGHAHDHGQAHGEGGGPSSAAPLFTQADEAVTAPDACKFCAASCSVTPLLSPLISLVAFTPLPETSFPALVAPPPSHLADAPDRPPQHA